MTSDVGAAESTRRLREVLERTAEALATADLPGLLQSEVELAVAIGRVAPLTSLSAAERTLVRQEIEGVQQALDRCRRLGGALLDVVRIDLESQGRNVPYGRRDAGAMMAPARVRTTG